MPMNRFDFEPSLRVVMVFMIPLIILFGLYMQFNGDVSPGGGFQCGVIVSSAFIAFALIYGVKNETTTIISESLARYGAVLGVLIYGGVGLFSLLQGYNFLDYSSIMPYDQTQAQGLGVMFVEIGVGFAVCFSMINIYLSFVTEK